jgi:tetratricopeptide (TPR) repeat protein
VTVVNRPGGDASSRISTTAGPIAMANLATQIQGLEDQVARGQITRGGRADLVELLTMRGHILGRIADAERSAELAEQFVHDAPADGLSFFARARTRAGFHRFTNALSDLDEAQRLGMGRDAVKAERAGILRALGRYDEALAFERETHGQRPDFETLGALAVLHAEQGNTRTAEGFFNRCHLSYLAVSPFPLAMLDFQRGLMWMRQENLDRARLWFDAARRRLSAYAPAQGHLAEVEGALGEVDAAIASLRRLTLSSDDPDYAAQLARILADAGRADEALECRASAASRYDELIARHPEAFADHAAEFWLATGREPGKALALAKRNLEIRRTARAHELVARANRAVLADCR